MKITRKVQREVIVAAVLIGLAIITVSSVRRHLWATNKRIQNRHDVYFLPPPAQVERLSLGYKYALADVLWAHVLVSQGLHTFERRRFENLLRLYDTINLLDPKWRTPYLLADALITFQATTTPLNEVIKAREILERGVKNRPFDGEIWLNLGQFVSFVAPSSYIEIMIRSWPPNGGSKGSPTWHEQQSWAPPEQTSAGKRSAAPPSWKRRESARPPFVFSSAPMP